MKEIDKNENPNILANVRGIGVMSKHGRELNLVADAKVHELADSLEKEYTKDEQYYILDRISSELLGLLLERGEDSKDPE